MRPREPRLYLQDIEVAISRILEFTSGGRAEFFESALVHDAVIRQFEIIGEAVRNLPEEMLADEPEISWKRAVHAKSTRARLLQRRPRDRLGHDRKRSSATARRSSTAAAGTRRGQHLRTQQARESHHVKTVRPCEHGRALPFRDCQPPGPVPVSRAQSPKEMRSPAKHRQPFRASR